MIIRRARTGEAAALSQLALHSKALWGYDVAFIERCRGPLAITEAMIASRPIFVADEADSSLGVVALHPAKEELSLTHLFVAPGTVRRGIGRALWNQALAEGRRLGFNSLTIESDPFAEGFYLRLGARRIGTRPSDVEARRLLPLLRASLDGP